MPRNDTQLSDIEMQHPGNGDSSYCMYATEHNQSPSPPEQNPAFTKSACLQALFSFSALPSDQVRQCSTNFCTYLESRFDSLSPEDKTALWTNFRRLRPTSGNDCWALIGDVCTMLPKLDQDGTIDDICKNLAVCDQGDTTQFDRVSNMDTCRVVVFATLCWLTMTLDPVLPRRDVDAQLSIQRQSLGEQGLRMTFAKRPIWTVFRQFGRLMPTTRWHHPLGLVASTKSVSLEVSCLNYKTLRDIGKINIVWVSDLSSHLDFEVNKRQLCVFRFPSFCAMSILAGREAAVSSAALTELTRQLCIANESADDTDSNNDKEEPIRAAQLHQEVLMSYRLLFGQKHSSRTLAARALKRQRQLKPVEYDSLLDVLCTKPYQSHVGVGGLSPDLWPVTCLSFDGTLQEGTSYSSYDDFPLFGQRLAKLQDFTLRQQPSKFMDLWRDRRNPLQWYTFWAVLIVGGVSILLSILQLGVAVAQLVLSIEGNR